MLAKISRNTILSLLLWAGVATLAIGFVMMVVGTFWMLTLCKIKF